MARGTCPLSAVLLYVNFSCTVEYGPTARLAAVEYYETAVVRLSFRVFIGGGGRTIVIIVHYGRSNYYVPTCNMYPLEENKTILVMYLISWGRCGREMCPPPSPSPKCCLIVTLIDLLPALFHTMVLAEYTMAVK